jgi:uncharacterized protein
MLTTVTETYARVLSTSLIVLDHILSHDECDVDPVNPVNGDTPLHVAVKLENPNDRAHFVEELLEAGADYGCVRFPRRFFLDLGL